MEGRSRAHSIPAVPAMPVSVEGRQDIARSGGQGCADERSRSEDDGPFGPRAGRKLHHALCAAGSSENALQVQDPSRSGAVRPSVRLHQRVLLNSSEAGSGRFFGSPNTGNRPAWFTDNGLKNQGFAPTDDTYKYLKAFRKAHPNWYVRGHLCMKLHAARISPEAEWNTHTMLNAVPPPGVQCRYLAGSRVQDGRLG